jgi:hypothetical protein
MEPSKTKYAMQYGLYLGVYICLRFFLGITHLALFSVISFIMLFGIPVLIYYVIKNYRDKQLNGVISLGAAWGLGFGLYFFSGMIVELVQFIYFRFINQDILAQAAEAAKVMYEKFNVSTENINMIDKIMQPHFYVISDFFVSFILGGCIISLIIAGFVQRKATPFQ